MRRLITVSLLLVSFVFVQPQASAQTPVALSIEGPTAMTPGQVGIFYLNLTGGPTGGNITFSVKYWVQGPDMTGASPLVGSPEEQSGQNGTFKVNMTAPGREGDIDLIVEATVKNATANSTARRTITLHVLVPLILTASFANSGGAAVLNATVNFYVDDVFAGSRVIARINPGERGTATLNWIPVGLGSGRHTVRAEVDIDKDGVIDAAKGEVSSYELFFKTGGELAPGYLLVIGITIALIGLIAILAYRRRAKAR